MHGEMKEQTAILFAHGAGAPSTSAWMRAWTTRLERVGTVIPFDYPYMAAGRRYPDRMPKLIEAHRDALNALREQVPSGTRILLCGKSMGSRVGCHLSLEEEVAGVICLGYPLKGAGKSGKLRDEVLLAMKRPVLFCQGTRDRLCPLDLLESVRGRMTARNELFIADDGDHSLTIAKRRLKAEGLTQDECDAMVLDRIERFRASL